jgi:hypothetical protein
MGASPVQTSYSLKKKISNFNKIRKPIIAKPGG